MHSPVFSPPSEDPNNPEFVRKYKIKSFDNSSRRTEDSAEFVSTLREELDGMKPVLDRKNKAADAMMKDEKSQTQRA